MNPEGHCGGGVVSFQTPLPIFPRPEMDSDKAYFLGLFTADGHLPETGNLNIVSKNRSFLEDVASSIDSNVYFRKNEHGAGDTRYTAIFRCDDAEHLVRFTGYTGGYKADKLFFPEWIPERLRIDFIRGYLDGDGCIYANQDNFLRMAFTSICKDFLIELRNELCQQLGVRGSLAKHEKEADNHHDTYLLKYAHFETKLIAEKVFPGDTPSLKRGRWETLQNQVKTDVEQRVWLKHEEDFLKNNYEDRSNGKIANSLSKSQSAVKRKAGKLNLTADNQESWSREEEQFLEENIADMNYREIGEELGRTNHSVSAKARRMDLSRSEK